MGGEATSLRPVGRARPQCEDQATASTCFLSSLSALPMMSPAAAALHEAREGHRELDREVVVHTRRRRTLGFEAVGAVEPTQHVAFLKCHENSPAPRNSRRRARSGCSCRAPRRGTRPAMPRPSPSDSRSLASFTSRDPLGVRLVVDGDVEATVGRRFDADRSLAVSVIATPPVPDGRGTCRGAHPTTATSRAATSARAPRTRSPTRRSGDHDRYADRDEQRVCRHVVRRRTGEEEQVADGDVVAAGRTHDSEGERIAPDRQRHEEQAECHERRGPLENLHTRGVRDHRHDEGAERQPRRQDDGPAAHDSEATGRAAR